jgi:hypothetical protein
MSLASAAYAIDVDFTAVGGDTSEWEYTTSDGITVKVSPGAGDLSFDEGDGYFVSGSSTNPGDWLTVTFWDGDTQVDVVVDSISVSDLFRQTTASGRKKYKEIGAYETDGSDAVKFNKKKLEGYDKHTGSGTLVVDASTSALTLTSLGSQGKNGKINKTHDYFLSGISFHVESVPELTASGSVAGLFLLGGMGLVLGGWRRRAPRD